MATSMAYPQEASTLMFFYRKDLLQKYGVTRPPGDRATPGQQLHKICLTLKDKLAADGQKDVYPMVFGVKSDRPRGDQRSTGRCGRYGGELIDDKCNPTFNTPKGVAAP